MDINNDFLLIVYFEFIKSQKCSKKNLQLEIKAFIGEKCNIAYEVRMSTTVLTKYFYNDFWNILELEVFRSSLIAKLTKGMW